MWRALDLDALLSEEERIPSVFRVDAQGLGFLDSTNDRANLAQGSRVELPLFMAKALRQRGMTDMELPKHYDRKMRNNIAASALNINLKEYTPYYFEVGMELASELRDNDLKDTVRIAFCGDRYRSLMINALSSSESDAADVAKDLTVRETDLYKAGTVLQLSHSLSLLHTIIAAFHTYVGVETVREIDEWKRQRASLLKKSSVLGRRSRSSGIDISKPTKKTSVQETS